MYIGRTCLGKVGTHLDVTKVGRCRTHSYVLIVPDFGMSVSTITILNEFGEILYVVKAYSHKEALILIHNIAEKFDHDGFIVRVISECNGMSMAPLGAILDYQMLYEKVLFRKANTSPHPIAGIHFTRHIKDTFEEEVLKQLKENDNYRGFTFVEDDNVKDCLTMALHCLANKSDYFVTNSDSRLPIHRQVFEGAFEGYINKFGMEDF